MAMGRRRQGAAAGVVRGEQRDSRAGPEPLRRVRGRNIVGDGRASPRPCPRAGGDSKRILIQAAAFNLRFSPVRFPPTIVSSTSTTPTSVGPESGSLPIASRMRWQRYQAVL